MTNFNNKTVAELKLIAKEMGLDGYSKLKKALLIEWIESNSFYEQEKKTAAKINFRYDTYNYGDIKKHAVTHLPLNGKYENEYDKILYFKNGLEHNENGPAEFGRYGNKQYLINGKYHRLDGPAYIDSDGDYIWYINDYYIEKEIMDNWLKENDIPLDWKIWTDSDKMMFALHWSDYNGEYE